MDGVGLEILLDLPQNLILAGPQLVRRHHQRNTVDAGGEIFHHKLIFLQNLQNAPQSPYLVAHAVFSDGDDGEILPPGNAGNKAAVLGFLQLVKALPNHGAGVVGLVGVADVQRDILLPNGEDGPLMEHLRADVAQLPQLRVGDALDGQRITDDPGIGHEEAGHIRPVFIYIRVQRRRRQRAGDVAAAPGEGLDGPVGHGAVKAGDHDPSAGGRTGEGFIAGLLVHGAVQIEFQPQLTVQKVVPQIVCHELRGKVLAPAHQLVLADALVHFAAQSVKLRLQIGLQPQVVPNFHVAGADHIKHIVAGHAVFQMRMAQIQQICQLMVIGKPLSGGGYDDHPPGRIGLHNALHFFKLPGVRHGGAAELQHL